MKVKRTVRIAAAVCAASLVQAYAPSGHAEDRRPATAPSEFALPTVKAEGRSVDIKYHFTKKEMTLSRAQDSFVEHYENGVFRLFENGKVYYGLYIFEGNPASDVTFTGYYMTFPSAATASPPVYSKFVYDARKRRFDEEILLPKGKMVQEAGLFQIVAATGH